MSKSEPSSFRYAKDFPVGAVCVDFQDPESGLRGLVVRGPFSFCAYVGAPENHALYALEELEFRCHFGITFRGHGEAAGPLPEGWYFFGWDYAHFSDQLSAPELFQLDEHSEEAKLLKDFFERLPFSGKPRKAWTVEEVTEDVLDALVELKKALQESAQYAQAVRATAR